ncbi:copper amine oxidase N-terminal domain-containing protein [Anaerovorax sp. IOR16]|uniref:copper amine oxidase N-terminal domain-containing protein n=1 Tax=Anaerovorax sp. IOR16 TaxID=2773458 RepID=UPI0019D17026|nr:copper amine oxidase N-terminal domain-containing protein [Anaerovorax sp. IOR16]
MNDNERQIKRQNDFCNITEWQEHGITGLGVNVWNCESSGSSHGQSTRKRILDVSPNANIINVSRGERGNVNSDNYETLVTYQKKQHTVEEFINKYKIKTITSSNHGDVLTDTQESHLLNDLKKKYNLTMFNISGNYSDQIANGSIPSDVAIYISACQFNRNGNIEFVNRFSQGEAIDFSFFMGYQYGTSFSCPMACGMANLLIERYGDLSQEEIYKYFKMCALDIEDIGRDIKTGWGIPVLPKWGKKYITMNIGEKHYFVNGEKKLIDVEPEQVKYRTFVPLRFISEELGFDVKWNEQAKTAIISKGEKTIIFTIDNNVLIMNGKKEYMDVSPYQRNYRSFTPIRYCEYLGIKIDWIETEKKIMILEQ